VPGGGPAGIMCWMTESEPGGLFSALFRRGGVAAGDAAWLQAMLDAEAALARALEQAGLAPAGSGAAVTERAVAGRFDAADIGVQAALTGNPVPALVAALTAQVPAFARPAVHQGATSQDILDTAAMLLARRAALVIEADLAAAGTAAARLAAEHAGTVMAGRTLLQQAVPVTFGLVAAGWLTAVDEARARPSAGTGSPPSWAGRPGRWPRSARPGRRWPGGSRRNWACPPRCCPGTLTGCGSSSWPPPWPARARPWASWPATSPCWPSPR
jgi:hypothetical protein